MIKNNVLEKKVLIFGGGGFIGRATALALVNAGARVTTTDRKDFDVLKNIDLLDKLVTGYDVIINLLAIVNPHDLYPSRESQIVNVEFSKYLLESVLKNNPKCRVIFSSSQTVYGVTDSSSIDESHPTHPETTYAKQKREAEIIYENYGQKHNLDILILRFSNIYGYEAKNSKSVISFFMENAINNREIKIFGNGHELRDYIYIDDIVEALKVSIDRPFSHRIYNCGSSRKSSVKKIAENILKIVGSGQIINIPYPEEYAQYRGDIVLNSDLFKKETGWQPKTDISHGLKKMFEKYNKNYNL